MTKLVKLQQRCFRKAFDDGEMKCSLLAIVAHDDRCENGHNTFSITGELYRNGRLESAGCLHEWIGEHFPELAPLLKWHGCSTDGPLHYVANTCFHAGNRDHFGKAAGKERDLDAARQCAIWPDATDEELTAPGLKERLLARLPALLDDFRAAVESLGLVY